MEPKKIGALHCMSHFNEHKNIAGSVVTALARPEESAFRVKLLRE